MVDVNAAFAETRDSQLAAAADEVARWDARVASGKLVDLGNGRYQVSDPAAGTTTRS